MYRPAQIPADLVEVPELITFLQNELLKISNETIRGKTLSLTFDKTFVLPIKPQEGEVIYFAEDIVTPTPTAAGIYAYIEGSWLLMT